MKQKREITATFTHAVPDSFPQRRGKHLSVLFRNTIFRELLQRANEEMLFRSAFESYTFRIEQLGVFSPQRKIIRYLICPQSSLCFKRGR
jgi:hypothetical protein